MNTYNYHSILFEKMPGAIASDANAEQSNAAGDFAEALRHARIQKKITRRAVFELTGIAQPIYKMIESGRIFPDREKREALCEALGLEYPDNSANDSRKE